MRHRFLLACLVVSGFSGLAYELLWVRLLTLSFGTTTLSLSAVLAVFFGGLALGAWVAGRHVAKLTRPARVYGLIELAIGAVGLGLYPVIANLDGLFALIDPGHGLGGALARLLVAVPLLIVPTVLMGATLPVVCAAIIRTDDSSGPGTALIYGLNTLGAALGAYAVSYLMLPAFGVFVSTLLTVAANVIVGVAVLALTRTETSPGEVSVGTSPGEVSCRRTVRLAMAMTFLSGFAFICYEIVWARLFSSFLQGTIYGVGAVLICVLVGIGLGSTIVARGRPRPQRLGLWIAALQVVIIVSVVAINAGVPRIAHVLHSLVARPMNPVLAQHMQLLVVLVVLGLPTICSGATLPLVVRLIEQRAAGTGRALGSVYAANTVGAILASILIGFIVIPFVGSTQAVWLGTACVTVTAVLAGGLVTPRPLRPVGFAMAAVALGLALWGAELDVREIPASHQPRRETYESFRARQSDLLDRMAYFAEGRNASISVLDSGDSRMLLINGLGQGARHTRPPHFPLESLLVALTPMSHVEHPERGLLVGLGAGVTAAAMLDLGIGSLEVVELEPAVVGAVDTIFGGDSPVESDRVTLVVDDARHHLLVNATRHEGRYDIITSMPFHPWIAPALFTQEFFEIARASLSDHGVFATWVGTPRLDGPSVESVFRAFDAVFEHYVIYAVGEADAYYLVGANRPLTIDPDRLAALHEHPLLAGQPQLADPWFLPARLYASGNERTAAPPAGIVNTDDTAFLETHAPRAGRSSPVLRGFMADEHLLPSLVAEEDRVEVFEQVIEHLLGTPGGRLARRPTPVHAARAARTLAASRQFLDDRLVSYLEGRLALATGADELARTHLVQLAGDDDDLGRRARVFLAMESPSDLVTLDPSPAVIEALAALDPALAVEQAQDTDLHPEDEPIAWLARKAATTPSGTMTPEDRRTFARIARALRDTSHHGWLELMERFARDHELDQEADLLAARRRLAARRKVDGFIKEAHRAEVAGNLREAADLLARARSLAPGNEKHLQVHLGLLLRLGDDAAVDRVLDELRIMGRSEAYVQALVADAITGVALGAAQP